MPITLGSETMQVSASVGVSFFGPTDTIDADQLVRQADQAMYVAKQSGKNRYACFDAAQWDLEREFHQVVHDIEGALERGEFILYYQPKVNMRHRQVIGVEALIRWKRPGLGLLLPGSFLPTIENHAVSIKLGEWVIQEALNQMKQWQRQGLILPVSVNIGARQLQSAEFLGRLIDLLNAWPDRPANTLTLEILETSALGDIVKVASLIEACRELGVDFSLDDFGTGYSSLIYLKNLPANELKIDQTFVRDMLDESGNQVIVEGVIGLGNAFKRRVIAEGVESVEVVQALLDKGCELGQGYAIARPMPASEILEWISRWQVSSWTSDPQAITHD
jgi:EAL domain-containing protein (putative c-di-GMP-specific phosphodiesterase class I)